MTVEQPPGVTEHKLSWTGIHKRYEALFDAHLQGEHSESALETAGVTNASRVDALVELVNVCTQRSSLPRVWRQQNS